MKMLVTLGILAASISVAGVANAAATYASNPVYAGQIGDTDSVTCRVFNSSLGAVRITTRQIITNSGAVLSLASDTCAAPLAANKSCNFQVLGPGNLSFVCRVIVAGSTSDVTGIAEIFRRGAFFTQAFVRQP